MTRKTITVQFLLPVAAATLIALAGGSFYAARALRVFYEEHLGQDLKARATVLAEEWTNDPGLSLTPPSTALNERCRRLGQATTARITVILPDGTVIADSDEDPSLMDNHAARPEIIMAMNTGSGQSLRFSHTLRKYMMYAAVAMKSKAHVQGYVRVAVPATAIEKAIAQVFHRVGGGAAAAVLVVGLASAAFARNIRARLRTMRKGAEILAQGQLNYRFPILDSEELNEVAECINHMAAELQNRILDAQRQAHEIEAVLSSMQESVLAVDVNEKVLRVNREAGLLFDISPAHAQGRLLEEVIRNPELHACVMRVLDTGKEIEEECVLSANGERILHVRGSVLRDAEEHPIGAVLVLNDVTNLRRLETARKDFVANVSHEIKTPITSIMGYAETLLDEASRNPEDLERFLGIIKRQADRLNAIVEDILTVSFLDTYGEHREIERNNAFLLDVINAAVEVSIPKAAAKEIAIQINAPNTLAANINAPLLEQAIVNLIDNAIKYSPNGAVIELDVMKTEQDCLIQVRDHGPGIERAHIPRLFERFYRVDRARSRKLGGTGLGLSIVKHITRLHKGNVSVDSTIGAGSIFTITIPLH